MSIKDINFDFATASDAFPVERQVQYIRFLEVTSGGGIRPRIRVMGLGGGWDITLSPGRAVHLPAGERGFLLLNAAGVPMEGIVACGGPGWDIEDSSVAGVVSVVDTNFSITQAGQAFMPNYGYPSAAGMLPHIECYNPPGSGKVVEVKSFNLSTNLAAGTGVALVTAAPLSTATGFTIGNKLASGGQASVCQLLKQDNAAVIGAARQIFAANLVANGYIEKILSAPVLLNPGDSIRAYATVPACQLTLGLETVERAQV